MSAKQIIITVPDGYGIEIGEKNGHLIISMEPIQPSQANDSPVEGQPAPDAAATMTDSDYVNQTPAEMLWTRVQQRAKHIKVDANDLAQAMMLANPQIRKGAIDEDALNDGENWLALADPDSVRMTLKTAPEAPGNPNETNGPPDPYGAVESAIVAKIQASGGKVNRVVMVGELLNHLNAENLSKIAEPMLGDALRFIEGWEPGGSGEG